MEPKPPGPEYRTPWQSFRDLFRRKKAASEQKVAKSAEKISEPSQSTKGFSFQFVKRISLPHWFVRIFGGGKVVVNKPSQGSPASSTSAPKKFDNDLQWKDFRDKLFLALDSLPTDDVSQYTSLFLIGENLLLLSSFSQETLHDHIQREIASSDTTGDKTFVRKLELLLEAIQWIHENPSADVESVLNQSTKSDEPSFLEKVRIYKEKRAEIGAVQDPSSVLYFSKESYDIVSKSEFERIAMQLSGIANLNLRSDKGLQHLGLIVNRVLEDLTELLGEKGHDAEARMELLELLIFQSFLQPGWESFFQDTTFENLIAHLERVGKLQRKVGTEYSRAIEGRLLLLVDGMKKVRGRAELLPTEEKIKRLRNEVTADKAKWVLDMAPFAFRAAEQKSPQDVREELYTIYTSYDPTQVELLFTQHGDICLEYCLYLGTIERWIAKLKNESPQNAQLLQWVTTFYENAKKPGNKDPVEEEHNRLVCLHSYAKVDPEEQWAFKSNIQKCVEQLPDNDLDMYKALVVSGLNLRILQPAGLKKLEDLLQDPSLDPAVSRKVELLRDAIRWFMVS